MSTLPPYAGWTTFGRCAPVSVPPAVTSPGEQVSPGEVAPPIDVAVLGVPYDSSTSNRSGTRFGPRAIREQSLLLWGYNNALNVSPMEELTIVDAGDVEVIPVDVQATHRAIEQRAQGWLTAGAALVTLGGDHSITLPLLRAHAKVHGPLAVVHFDAHPDTWDEEYPGFKYSHGTPFARAIEEGLIDPTAYLQIGIRGPTYDASDYAQAKRLGARMITRDEFAELGIAGTLAEIRRLTTGKPLYVTFDIDCVDPAFAPGTGTPEVGGLSSYEALQLVRGLRGLRCVGFDLVEVSPPYDPTQITAILGANLAFEFLSVLALLKQHAGSRSCG